MCCSLVVALLATAPVEREEARRARLAASLSSVHFGVVRLEFKTLAPRANAPGITGTVHTVHRDPPLGGWVLHRILMDAERGLYYGYDIELAKAEGQGRFVATVKALDSTVEEEFREREWSDFCRDCQAPRPVVGSSQRFPVPLTVASGETLAIDLLADENSGERITEQVAFTQPKLRPRTVKVLPPQDLTAEAVFLQMADAKLRVNDEDAWPGESSAVQGDVLRTELPGHGRVFVSLVPRPGYDFKKIGVVAGDRISFVIDGNRYEWISMMPIVTSGPGIFGNVQSWYVWILHDPDYHPADRHGGAGAGFDERAMNRLKKP